MLLFNTEKQTVSFIEYNHKEKLRRYYQLDINIDKVQPIKNEYGSNWIDVIKEYVIGCDDTIVRTESF